jgi:membrane protease YdiL (CAAX protease family)
MIMQALRIGTWRRPSVASVDGARGQSMAMKMWWRLSLLGLIGAASMALMPFEQLVPTPIDPVLIRLASVVQPAILVMLLAALGIWAAPKVGLDAPAFRAWAERRPVRPALAPQVAPAVVGGLAVGLMLLLFWSFLRTRPYAAPILAIETPLVTRLLYGGIVEELLLRWGLMSLFVWIVWRLGGAPAAPRRWQVWAGLIAAALLFAVGHLPMLHFLLPDPPAELIALVVGANSVPGLIFGWLFWRRGLESAMMAHGLAHLVAAAAIAIVY